MIPPLRTLLGSQELAKHRAMLSLECEFLAKKFDLYGWERERGTAAQDRIKLDFMDALENYPLPEVQAACKQAVLDNPNKMPNEGRVLNIIRSARKRQRASSVRNITPEPEKVLPDAETRAAIMAKNGFKPKGFPKIGGI